MKSVTEFFNFTLAQGQKVKEELLAAGKTVEEISAAMAEKFKLKEEKIKHFMHSLEVAAVNSENLKRVHVVSLGEGEGAPAKAIKVEEFTYIPEFLVLTKQAPAKADPRARGKGDRKGGGRGNGPKESPWGLSEEQKAEKKKAQSLAAAAARTKKPN